MSTERPHPPSVEAVLSAVRRMADVPREPVALLDVAREVVAQERNRLAVGR